MNNYNDLIEMMFADGTLDSSVRQEIEGLSDLQKRLHIVKILDKGLGLFTKIESIMNLPKMEYITEVIKILKDYVLIADVEKKKFGEVMTPLTLVKEMLATLPDDFWKNPSLKILDPSNGTGPYPIMAIYKLMNGLKDTESNDEKRYKHIVEEIIYVCELQPKNMFLYMCAIDPHDRYNLKVYTGSFLKADFDSHMDIVWGTKKFSLIFGNPPYNPPISNDVKKGTTGNFIWDKFVMKSIDLIEDKGFLNFVHPPGWRKPTSEKAKNKGLLDVISKLQIHYLEIHDVRDGLKVFGAGTRYDFYLIENSKTYKETIIKSEDGKIQSINLPDWKFIPNKCFDEIKSILASASDEVCPVVYDRTSYGADKKHISRERSDLYCYPVVHATNKSGVRYVYSCLNNKGHYGVKKVIFGDSGINDVVIDINGDYAMSHHAMGILVESVEEAEFIKTALLSKKFKVIIDSLSYSNFTVDWKMFTFFKRDFWKEFT